MIKLLCTAALLTIGIIGLYCSPLQTHSSENIPELNLRQLDTCEGSYNSLIDSLNYDKVNNISAKDIWLLRCLKMRAVQKEELRTDTNIWQKYKEAKNINDNNNIIQFGTEVLKTDILNIRIHDDLFSIYESRKDTINFNYHLNFIQKYIESFKLMGDGLSIEHPLQVFGLSEEYQYLALIGLKSKMQSLILKNGRKYDMQKCKNKEGSTIKVYFDITSYWYYTYEPMMNSIKENDSTKEKRKIILQ